MLWVKLFCFGCCCAIVGLQIKKEGKSSRWCKIIKHCNVARWLFWDTQMRAPWFCLITSMKNYLKSAGRAFMYCKCRFKSSIWRTKIYHFNFWKIKPYMGRRRRNASCHIFYEGCSWRLDHLLQKQICWVRDIQAGETKKQAILPSCCWRRFSSYHSSLSFEHGKVKFSL